MVEDPFFKGSNFFVILLNKFMKWYFASRTRHTEKLKEIAKFIESKGQTLSSDWIYERNLKPFLENIDEVRNLNDHNINQMINCDIFVMFNDPEGIDIFTEYGVCLAAHELGHKKKFYIICDVEKVSLMQHYKDAIHVKDLKEVFEREEIDMGDFVLPIVE